MTTSTLSDEIVALTEGCAVAAHALRGLVRVQGEDRVEWFDRLSSNPVRDLPADRCVPTTLMDGKGKMFADFRVLTGADELLLDVPGENLEMLMRRLDLYVIQDDVRLVDASGELGWLSVLGPRASDVLAALGWPRPEGDAVARGDGFVAAVASRRFGVDGVDFVVDLASRSERLERIREAGAVAVDVAALDVARLRAGVPWFERDLADGTIPLEALLDDHVSTTKGCYPGNEVCARIVNLGQVSRKLVRLSAAPGAEVEPGAELLGTGEKEGKTAGTLTSLAHDPVADRTLGLGFARRAFWRTGTPLRAGDVEFTVESLDGDD